MPIYWLPPEPVFPDPRKEELGDLVAAGGDLSPSRLIQAYSQGIFPWYEMGSPILWWSPDPRLILDPDKLHVPSRLERLIRQNRFRVSLDLDFPAVINSCARVHSRRCHGTWILPEMISAYSRLHELGFAHSVEVWSREGLVGGIYGVALKKAFFGESMFFLERNASKVALVSLVRFLRKWGFYFMDCQQTTRHLLQFGAQEISRAEFLSRLDMALNDPQEVQWWPGWWENKAA